MKQLLLNILFLAAMACRSFSQIPAMLEEGKMINIDGIELSFRITNESTKAAGKEEFARYKVIVFANNKQCDRFYRNADEYSTSSYTRPRSLVATFYFRNANGKRFTSKEGNLNAKEWWIPIKTVERNNAGKDETLTRRMMAGYMLRNGEHLESEYIVLVPLGGKPKIEVIVLDKDNI